MNTSSEYDATSEWREYVPRPLRFRQIVARFVESSDGEPVAVIDGVPVMSAWVVRDRDEDEYMTDREFKRCYRAVPEPESAAKLRGMGLEHAFYRTLLVLLRSLWACAPHDYDIEQVEPGLVSITAHGMDYASSDVRINVEQSGRATVFLSDGRYAVYPDVGLLPDAYTRDALDELGYPK